MHVGTHVRGPIVAYVLAFVYLFVVVVAVVVVVAWLWLLFVVVFVVAAAAAAAFAALAAFAGAGAVAANDAFSPKTARRLSQRSSCSARSCGPFPQSFLDY